MCAHMREVLIEQFARRRLGAQRPRLCARRNASSHLRAQQRHQLAGHPDIERRTVRNVFARATANASQLAGIGQGGIEVAQRYPRGLANISQHQLQADASGRKLHRCQAEAASVSEGALPARGRQWPG